MFSQTGVQLPPSPPKPYNNLNCLCYNFWVKEISLQEIRAKVDQFIEEKKAWHFHLLTPACKFNKKDKFAFILENTTENEIYVHYSAAPVLELGKELLSLLHGVNVLKKENQSQKQSPTLQTILKKARELNQQGKFWHHHMFFPNCIFNKNKGKWVILFEDQETNQIIESIYNSEPKEDLKQIETLYYQQKTIE